MAKVEDAAPDMFNEGPVSYAIFQLHVAHRGYAAALLRRMGLHPGQELILMHLHSQDAQTQSELLARIGVDPSTLSKALLRMQNAGLLVREPADHDHRVRVVRLTEKGAAMREPISAMWRALEEVTLQNLSQQQADNLMASAYSVVDAISNRTQAHDPMESETPRAHLRPSQYSLSARPASAGVDVSATSFASTASECRASP